MHGTNGRQLAGDGRAISAPTHCMRGCLASILSMKLSHDLLEHTLQGILLIPIEAVLPFL